MTSEYQRQVRRYLAEGKVQSFAEGELVVKLLEEKWPEEEVWLVIKETKEYEEALKLLVQECELCADQVTLRQMIKMPLCEHKCCKDCATNHFTIVITDQNISQVVCPFCREPLDRRGIALEKMATKLISMLNDDQYSVSVLIF